MPSTYSSNLKIELLATGENSGTWGNITNTNLGTALEQAVVGYGVVDYVADANLTISITNSNSAQAARALVLNVTSGFGSLTQTRELVVPTIEKQYIVQNNTTGSQSITVKTSAGTGITVPNGRKAHLYVDGTNVIQMFDFVDINGGTIDGTPIGGSSAAAGSFTTLGASGAVTFNGAVTLGDAAADLLTFNGTVNSHLLFTDNTYDIGASGATRPRNLFLAGNATVGGNLSVGGTLTLTGGVNLNGNVTVGDNASDTLTINSTITSNLLFTDNTYDIGASGATRPRNLFLAGNATIGGSQTLTGALTVDSTTDSSSTTTGSIQTDGGLGVAKALYVGTTANIAGAVTLGGGTANGVAYLNGSKVLTTGGSLSFNGTNRLALAASGAVSAEILIDAPVTGNPGLSNQIVFKDTGSDKWSLGGSNIGVAAPNSFGLYNYPLSSVALTIDIATNNWVIPTGTFTTNYGATFNEAGADSDFRVESDNNTHMLFVDASTDRVGINNSSPVNALSVTGEVNWNSYRKYSINRATTANNILSVVWAGTKTFKGVVRIGVTYPFSSTAARSFVEFLIDADTAAGGGSATLLRQFANFDDSTNYSAGVNYDSTTGTLTAWFRNNPTVEQDATVEVFVTTGSLPDSTPSWSTSAVPGTALIPQFLSTNGAIAAGSASTTGHLYLYDSAKRVQLNMLTDTTVTNTAGLFTSVAHNAFTQGVYVDGSGYGHGFLSLGYFGDDGRMLEIGTMSSATTANATFVRHHILYPSGAVVFNEQGYDADFRVESDTNTHMLFVDASTNRVGIAQSSPGYELHVGAQQAVGGTAGTIDRFAIQPYSNTGGPYIFKARTVSGSSDFLDLYYGSAQIASFGLNQRVGIRTTAPNATLHVDGDVDTIVAQVSAPLYENGGGSLSKYLDIKIGNSYISNYSIAQAKLRVYGNSWNNSASALEIYTMTNAGADVSNVLFGQSESVFNENSGDIDFRVESNNNSHMLFVDAGNDVVSIGTSTVPNWYSSDTLQSNTWAITTLLGADQSGWSTGCYQDAYGYTSNWKFKGNYPATLYAQSGDHAFFVTTSARGTGNAITWREALRLSDGAAVFNEESYDIDFRVESDANTHALFVDAGLGTVCVNGNGANGNSDVAGFQNLSPNAVLSGGSGFSTVAVSRTQNTAASNNATVDAFRFLDVGSARFGSSWMSGHFYINVTGASGANQYAAIYKVLTTGNGTTFGDSVFSLESSITRGTSPVASVALVDDSTGGFVKLQITYIDNSGVVTGGSSTITFIGQTSTT